MILLGMLEAMSDVYAGIYLIPSSQQLGRLLAVSPIVDMSAVASSSSGRIPQGEVIMEVSKSS